MDVAACCGSIGPRIRIRRQIVRQVVRSSSGRQVVRLSGMAREGVEGRGRGGVGASRPKFTFTSTLIRISTLHTSRPSRPDIDIARFARLQLPTQPKANTSVCAAPCMRHQQRPSSPRRPNTIVLLHLLSTESASCLSFLGAVFSHLTRNIV